MSHGRRKPHNNFLNVYSYVEITGNVGRCLYLFLDITMNQLSEGLGSRLRVMVGVRYALGTEFGSQQQQYLI